jgi:tRNA(Ile)-lysidine synthetase-like protein
MNLEAAARQARYEFLGKTALEVGAAAVLTAHHADDQAETLLLHLVRGSGLQGLAGMLPVAPLPYLPQVRLLRPLLTIRRAELEAYCQTHHLTPRHDETNDDTTLRRNALRHEILPRLAQMNPQIVPALGRLASTVQSELNYLAQRYEQEVIPHLIQRNQRIRLPLALFQALHPAMQQRFLRDAVQRLPSGVSELDFERLQAAQAAAQAGKVGTLIEFAQGVRLRCEYTMLCVEHTAAPPELPPYYLPAGTARPLALNTPYTLYDHWTLELCESPTPNSLALTIPLQSALTLRTRQAGDVIRLQGHQRKLKEWFINTKVPQAWRDLIPLLCADGAIIALGLPHGWQVAESTVIQLTKLKSHKIIYLVSVHL